MPHESGKRYFQNEADFKKAFAAFNALAAYDEQWQPTTARKDHEDIFGKRIRDGELYYKRQIGPAWDAVIKVSQLSMERLVYIVMAGNLSLQALGKTLQEQRFKALQEAHARFSPVDRLFAAEKGEETD